jgi:hypothetical protein
MTKISFANMSLHDIPSEHITGKFQSILLRTGSCAPGLILGHLSSAVRLLDIITYTNTIYSETILIIRDQLHSSFTPVLNSICISA